jgi:hypothetical protein
MKTRNYIIIGLSLFFIMFASGFFFVVDQTSARAYGINRHRPCTGPPLPRTPRRNSGCASAASMMLLAVLLGACAVPARGGGGFLAPQVAAAGPGGAASFNLTEGGCGGAVDVTGACQLQYYRWHNCEANHGPAYDSWTCSCSGGPPGDGIPQDFTGRSVDLQGWASQQGGCCLGHGETYDSWYLTDCR